MITLLSVINIYMSACLNNFFNVSIYILRIHN
jgi:hypothetical protein